MESLRFIQSNLVASINLWNVRGSIKHIEKGRYYLNFVPSRLLAWNVCGAKLVIVCWFRWSGSVKQHTVWRHHGINSYSNFCVIPKMRTQHCNIIWHHWSQINYIISKGLIPDRNWKNIYYCGVFGWVCTVQCILCSVSFKWEFHTSGCIIGVCTTYFTYLIGCSPSYMYTLQGVGEACTVKHITRCRVLRRCAL